MKNKVLVLNANYQAYDVMEAQDAFIKIWSGGMNPLDLYFEENEDGCVDLSNVSYFTVIEGSKDWCNAPVRPYDNFYQTVKGPIRIPEIVICSNYKDIPKKNGMFSTKSNILKRDLHVCQYSNIKLWKEVTSIDHVFPVSLCYENPNTWENQVACHKELNNWKADRLPEQCIMSEWDTESIKCPILKEWKKNYRGKTLKLLKYPSKPANQDKLTFFESKDAWSIFLKSN